MRFEGYAMGEAVRPDEAARQDAAAPRKRPLSKRKRRTYLGLLTTAIALLEEKGFDAVSVRELADLAGITPMTIYNVFGSKEALLSAAIEYRTQEFIDQLDHEADRHGFAGLIATNARVVARAIGSNQLMRSVAGMLARDTTLFAVRQIYLTFHCRYLREMKAQGFLAACARPEALAMMMMTAHNAVINAWVNDEIDDRTVAALFDLQTCNAVYPVVSDAGRPDVDACYRDRMRMLETIDFDAYFGRSRRPPGRFDITTLSAES